MRRIHDISLPLSNSTFVYPGNPEVRFELQQSIARGAGANVSALALGSHTGTHVDAQKHFFDDGAGVDGISLEVLVGPAVVLEFGEEIKAIGAADLERAGFNGSERVLLKTRNSALLHRADFTRDYTYLAPDGAELLAQRGVRLVGIDYLSVEQFRSGHHRTHLILLGKGIAIVEGLDLSPVAPGRYELICLPLRLAGLDGAPARAILIETEA